MSWQYHLIPSLLNFSNVHYFTKILQHRQCWILYLWILQTFWFGNTIEFSYISHIGYKVLEIDEHIPHTSWEIVFVLIYIHILVKELLFHAICCMVKVVIIMAISIMMSFLLISSRSWGMYDMIKIKWVTLKCYTTLLDGRVNGFWFCDLSILFCQNFRIGNGAHALQEFTLRYIGIYSPALIQEQ